MNKIIAAAATATLLLSACTPSDQGIENQTEQVDSNKQSATEVMSSGTATPIVGSTAEANAFQEETLSAQQMLDSAESVIASRIIYFDYDSASVSDDSLALLESHGEFIASNGEVHVTLAGHADERGSREYNIALGDRRAQSVRRILLFQGASSDQIESISYGEEQPAVRAHDEAAWSKNRRVELLYEIR